MARNAGRAATLLALTILAATPEATAQTREFLRAPRVQSRVRVQWDPVLQRIVAAVDDDDRFQPLAASQPFLTDGSLTITYPRLNPLRVSAAIALGEPAVSADSVTARLRSLLLLAPASVPPLDAASDPAPFGAFTSPESCTALTTARGEVDALMSKLLVMRSSATVAAHISSWRQSIDDAFAAGRDGAAAVSIAVALMDRFVAQLDGNLTESDRILTRIAAETARATPTDSCTTAARAVYEVLALANPRARLAQLATVRAAVVSLREALTRDFVAPGAAKWQGVEYRLSDQIRPTRESTVTVGIRVTHLRLDVDQSSGAAIAMEESTGSDTLVVQRFSRFAKEFAVATVIGSVTRQGYGTTTNESGLTVVGRLPRPFVSVEPAFLASFVCRCQTGPFIAPMLQAGISTSKDVPALLVGGGIRLFGLPKGEVALGGGGMIAWVKDLRRLHVGGPVGGTSDIEADLHYVRRHGFYAALQYKF